MSERRRSTSRALALLKARRRSADSQDARRLRDEQIAAGSSSGSSEPEEGDMFVEGRAESTDSEQRRLRRRREHAATRQAQKHDGHGALSDVGDFIVDSDEEEEEDDDADGMTSAAAPAFSHFAFDMVRDADREIERGQPGLGLLQAFGEKDGAWSSWSRRRSFDWYLRFLASAIAWRLAPALLRLQPETVDARAYAACVRTWEGSLVHVKESLVASQAWSGKEWVRQRLDRLPLFEASTHSHTLGAVRCEICERRNHPASVLLRVSGSPAAYDGPAVWDRGAAGTGSAGFAWERKVPRGAPPPPGAGDGGREDLPPLGGDAAEEADWGEAVPAANAVALLPGDVAVGRDGVARAAWRAGRFCALRVSLYSRLVHWKVAAMARVADVVWRWAVAPDALEDEDGEDEDEDADEEQRKATAGHAVGKATVIFDDEEDEDDEQDSKDAVTAPQAGNQRDAGRALTTADAELELRPAAPSARELQRRFSISPSRPAPRQGYLGPLAASPERPVRRLVAAASASGTEPPVPDLQGDGSSGRGLVRRAPSIALLVRMARSAEWRKLVRRLQRSHDRLVELAQALYASSADRVEASATAEDGEWASACCSRGGSRRRGIVPLFVEALPSGLMATAAKLGLQDWGHDMERAENDGWEVSGPDLDADGDGDDEANQDDEAGEDDEEEDEEEEVVLSQVARRRSRGGPMQDANASALSAKSASPIPCAAGSSSRMQQNQPRSGNNAEESGGVERPTSGETASGERTTRDSSAVADHRTEPAKRLGVASWRRRSLSKRFRPTKTVATAVQQQPAGESSPKQRPRLSQEPDAGTPSEGSDHGTPVRSSRPAGTAAARTITADSGSNDAAGQKEDDPELELPVFEDPAESARPPPVDDASSEQAARDVDGERDDTGSEDDDDLDEPEMPVPETSASGRLVASRRRTGRVLGLLGSLPAGSGAAQFADSQ